jgi:hypothetical protein
MANVVVLKCLEYEENAPDKGDYLNLRAEAMSLGFSGNTEFWVARSDIERFLADLAEFESRPDGTVSLICGWGGIVYFRLCILAKDQLGHLTARIEIAKPAYDQEIHKLIIALETNLSAVVSFRASIRAILNTRLEEEAVLQER